MDFQGLGPQPRDLDPDVSLGSWPDVCPGERPPCFARARGRLVGGLPIAPDPDVGVAVQEPGPEH